MFHYVFWFFFKNYSCSGVFGNVSKVHVRYFIVYFCLFSVQQVICLLLDTDYLYWFRYSKTALQIVSNTQKSHQNTTHIRKTSSGQFRRQNPAWAVLNRTKTCLNRFFCKWDFSEAWFLQSRLQIWHFIYMRFLVVSTREI